MKFIMRTTGDRDLSGYSEKIPGLILSNIEERSAYKNFQNALKLSGNEAAVHLEDDIILCNDFIKRIMSIINAHENDVIQFFSGTRKDDTVVGTRYVNGAQFLWAQCFYIPSGMSDKILDYSNTWEERDDGTEALDSMVACYLKQQGLKYLHICPSLVDHKEGKSLINNKRNPKRVSNNFIMEQCANKTVAVTCEGTGVIDYKTLKPIQGKLKSRTSDQIKKLIRSIIEVGFSFPFFVWKNKDINYTIDGHGRLQVLNELENHGYIINNADELIIESDEGWSIPELPVVYIEAENLNDAKKKLLKANSMYGHIEKFNLDEFSEEFNVKEMSGIEIKIYENNIELPASENTEEIIDIGKINISPNIEISAVTEEDIIAAEEKLGNRKAVEVDTVFLKCKHCGETFEVRKSDVAIKINDTLLSQENEENYG